MRVAVRGVVFIEGKLLLMHRIKNGNEYWVIPGGGVEEGESYEETVVREVEEEIGIQVRPIKEIVKTEFIASEGSPAVDIFYLCEYMSGEVGTGTGVEFMERSSKENIYEVQLVSKNELHKINLVPEEMRPYLLEIFPT